MSGIAVAKNNLIVPRPPEFKAAAFQVKATDDSRGIIEGILNAIGNIDDGKDRTMANAFKKTLNDSYSRKSAQHLAYLWPYLWSHDPNEPPIGGIFDADEVKASGDTPAGLFVKVQLILDIERARDVYACFKAQEEGTTKSSGLLKQSMGYKTIRSEYVNEKIDGQVVSVRNLLEVQVWEGSAVVFPMNDLSIVTNVKSGDERTGNKRYFFMDGLEEKTVCGDTSLSIGPRDESWDGSAAKKQIFDYASKDDGSIDASKAKKCFLQVDGDTSLKGSYGYPFVNIVDGSPRINVGGVIAAAGALAGDRGASTEGDDIAGMRRKVDTMYSKINKKYPNDPELSGTWNEKDKASETPVDKKEKKDFNTLFMAAQAADALEDWGDLVDTLTQAMMQAFCIGDTPQTDMQDALNQFGVALMAWCEKAVQCGLPDYLGDRYGYNNSTPYVPYSMRVGGYDSMSRHGQPEGKVGARISGDTKKTLQDHVDDLNQMATEHKTLSDQLAAQQKSMTKAMNAHADMLEQKASDLTNLWKQEGQGDAYSQDDTGKSNTQTDSATRREPSTATLTRTPTPQPRTLTEDEELKALEAAFAGWTKK